MLQDVPNLYLGTTPEIDTTVAPGCDLPLKAELEVFKFLLSDEMRAFSVKKETVVLHMPVLKHEAIRLFLLFGPLGGGQGSFSRGRSDQTGPARQIGAIKELDGVHRSHSLRDRATPLNQAGDQ